MVWSYLSGHSVDLQILRDLFPRDSGNEFWVGEEEYGTFLVSAALDDFADAGYRAPSS